MSDIFQQIYDYKYWFFSKTQPRNNPTTRQDFLEFGYTSGIYHRYINLCQMAITDIIQIHPTLPTQSSELAKLISFCIATKIIDEDDNDPQIIGSNLQVLYYINYTHNLSSCIPLDAFRLYFEECLAWGGDFDAPYIFLIDGLSNTSHNDAKPNLERSSLIKRTDLKANEFVYQTESVTAAYIGTLLATAFHIGKKIQNSIHEAEEAVKRFGHEMTASAEPLRSLTLELFLLYRQLDCHERYIELLQRAADYKRSIAFQSANDADRAAHRGDSIRGEAAVYYREKSYPISKYNKRPRYFGNYQGGGFSPR